MADENKTERPNGEAASGGATPEGPRAKPNGPGAAGGGKPGGGIGRELTEEEKAWVRNLTPEQKAKIRAMTPAQKKQLLAAAMLARQNAAADARQGPPGLIPTAASAARARPPGAGQQRPAGPGGQGQGAGSRPGGGQKQGPRQVQTAYADPFTPVKRMPKFGQLARHQKIIVAVCVTAIVVIATVLFGTDWVHIPGRDLGAMIRHNTDFLGESITLPRKPVSTTWQMMPHDEAGASVNEATHWQIIAVMQFSYEDMAALVAAAQDKPQAADAAIEIQHWFPADVKAAMQARPPRSIDPSPFFGERYKRGSAIIVTGTNTIVVRLLSD
ncbi:MAG TPA: hypothetical protein VHA10_04795 [Hypericibacter adhaerens]|uniref:hypothetical protein n=1 Tax=Hypericibacter adhaerens TaxID=2602016 RepID=UPI002B6425D3|nr:hypothetical protein [Hypericibacter adhaerens]HWA42506.1 hypothetical protein [Hypericibacter adhaerens]